MTEFEEVVTDNRCLNRWILRVAYLMQNKQKQFLANVLLFTEESKKVDNDQWHRLMVFMVQSIYITKLVDKAVFNLESGINLFCSNADMESINEAKKEAYNWYMNIPAEAFNFQDIKQTKDDFELLIGDTKTSYEWLTLPKISEDIQNKAKDTAIDYFFNLYENNSKLMQENKIHKDNLDAEELLNMPLTSLEWTTKEKLEVMAW